MTDFWLKVGDRVSLYKEPELKGTITHIDENLIEEYGVTTCLILWDDFQEETDCQ